MSKNKKDSPNNNEDVALPVFAKMSASSLAAFSAFAIILVSLVFYGVGYNAAQTNVSSQENLGGLAYEYEPVSASHCVLYSDEILITDENCSLHSDCNQNGICYQETGTCAYFLN
jgi:hypothetical protein